MHTNSESESDDEDGDGWERARMSGYSTFTGVSAKEAKEEVEAYAVALNQVGGRGNEKIFPCLAIACLKTHNPLYDNEWLSLDSCCIPFVDCSTSSSPTNTQILLQ